MAGKPTIALDFDGVIHSYEKGWSDGTIYGTVVHGFEDWYWAAQPHFNMVVHTSRETEQVRKWLLEHGLEMEVYAEKPPAFLSIDDRCVRFMGNWSDPSLQPKSLMHFRPWTMLDQRPDPRD